VKSAAKPRASTKIEFHPMHADDIDAALAIEQSVQAFPWSRGNFVDSLEASHGCWLMLENRQLLGFAVMMVAFDEAELLNIGIIAQRQREGLGGRFMEFLFEFARSQGVKRVFLEVRPSNAIALALYDRFGFTEAGLRANYYPAANGREDALVLEKPL
jgi:ribosomal-protein-alanine N-acetyltransferase